MISISPEGRWLAVILAEEGHPLLYLYALEAFLHNDAADLQPITIINPYPGIVRLGPWVDRDTLRIKSDADLLQSSDERETGEEKLYSVHLPDGKLQLLD